MSCIKHMLLASVLLVLAACGEAAPDEVEASPAIAAHIAVEDFSYTRRSNGDRVVAGKLYNNGSKPIRNAQVQVSLFDDHNRRISSMHIPVHDIPAGAYRAFEAPLDTRLDVQGARVRSVLLL